MKTCIQSALIAAFGFAISVSAHAQQSAPVPVSFTNAQGIALKGFLFAAAASETDVPRGAVIMMHGCGGAYSYSQPNAGYTNIQTLFREWGNALVRDGYVALLVDSFTGRTDPSTGAAVPQNQCGNGAAGVSEVKDRPLDALAGYDYLVRTASVRVDPHRIALLGWSHGGSSVMAALSTTQARQPFRAGVSFYPGCGLYGAFGGIVNSAYVPYAPFKIFHGEADPLYMTGYCQTRRDRAWQAGDTNFRIIEEYAGARHSFDGCRSVSGSCILEDVVAKSKADAAARNFFSDMLR